MAYPWIAPSSIRRARIRSLISSLSARVGAITPVASRSCGERSSQRSATSAPRCSRATSDTRSPALRQGWSRQAADLGFSAENLVEYDRARQAAALERPHRRITAISVLTAITSPIASTWRPGSAAWAVDHLSEREAVFSHNGLLAATLGRDPGAVTVEEAEQAVHGMQRDGRLHAAMGLKHGKHWATDAALARGIGDHWAYAGRPGQVKARHEAVGVGAPSPILNSRVMSRLGAYRALLVWPVSKFTPPTVSRIK